MNTSIAAQSFNAAEPIPGYRMIERIGAGGYGEVWKAEAPGGIAKAIKVVYGYQDDERASRELSALNRIKEVRHPFVLSLERIELVAGHLVIVTELATASMKMLFTDHRSSGLAGIPRSELLGYLRDAADALDYLYHEHSLQHLDVKPENLLLVGGRVKVADFGLVKDLQDVNCSMINGLTPVYAAPELFDGRPNCHSDQYSLAIVYQEMLTGVPPFLGRTTAQLAAQHLHSRPRLDCLPASDQAVISRALSKDPEQRFPSCREMVESLGYRIQRLFIGVFAVGSALAGLGGVMWGLYQQNVTPQMGAQVNVLIFMVIIMGGLGSTSGSFLGAILIGLVANYTGFLAPKVALFSNILLMVAILLWRPQGLYSISSR